MHRFITICAALFLGVTAVSAQDWSSYDPTGKFSISVQGGPMLSISENAFSYKDNGKTAKLITPQASISVGYDFTKAFGLRANIGYGKNMSACNTYDTAMHGFYPYSFKNISCFVDAILQLNYVNNSWSAFCPKLYFGLGGAQSFGFNEVNFGSYTKNDPSYKRFHPWQDVNESNGVIAFRLGFIAEYNFSQNFGIFADITGEAYTDNFNGLMPKSGDFDAFHGYAGFPFDLRGLISLGAVCRF